MMSGTAAAGRGPRVGEAEKEGVGEFPPLAHPPFLRIFPLIRAASA